MLRSDGSALGAEPEPEVDVACVSATFGSVAALTFRFSGSSGSTLALFGFSDSLATTGSSSAVRLNPSLPVPRIVVRAAAMPDCVVGNAIVPLTRGAYAGAPVIAPT